MFLLSSVFESLLVSFVGSGRLGYVFGYIIFFSLTLVIFFKLWVFKMFKKEVLWECCRFYGMIIV